MTWMLHQQQQQCGAQLPKRPDEARQLGPELSGAPAEAVDGREAQDHEQAGDTLQPGDYPASPLEDRDQDPSTTLRTGITPSAPEPHVEWDDVVQPQRK